VDAVGGIRTPTLGVRLVPWSSAGSRIVAGQRLGDVHDCPALTAGAHEFCDQLCDHSREHSPVPQVSEGAASCGLAAWAT